MRFTTLSIIAAVGMWMAQSVSSFGIRGPDAAASIRSSPRTRHQSQSTVLFGRAIKRGALKDMSPGSVKKTSSQKKKKKSGPSASSRGASASAPVGGVSKKLSDWATSSSEGGITATTDASVNVQAEAVAPSRTNKGGSKKAGGATDRKMRQAERRAEEADRAKLVENTIDDLLDIFDPLDEEGNSKKQRKVVFDMSDVLSKIQTLIDNPNPSCSLRQLTAGQMRRDYRMIWAGSDEAICHLGTGLHNVPLARLEEVFMTLGKKRIEVNEVIRILGPFPNVRNQLKGDATTAKSGGASLQICYDSMIDGTGSQIIAGGDDSKKDVPLSILFADENAIVCAIPSDKGENPFVKNGSKVLLFASEDAMDVRLEMLRVG